MIITLFILIGIIIALIVVSVLLYRQNNKIKEIAELKAENESLKRELEHVKNGDCINTCDVLEKYGKELCATLRALWLARAERAKRESKYWYAIYVYEAKEEPYTIKCNAWRENEERFLRPIIWCEIWRKVEQLCMAKAEEYK